MSITTNSTSCLVEHELITAGFDSEGKRVCVGVRVCVCVCVCVSVRGSVVVLMKDANLNDICTSFKKKSLYHARCLYGNSLEKPEFASDLYAPKNSTFYIYVLVARIMAGAD